MEYATEQRMRRFNLLTYIIILPPKLKEFINHGLYFTAPASAGHHGNHSGGLFDHSADVAETLESLTLRENLKWQTPRSPVLIGLLHDICKHDLYIQTDDGVYIYNVAAGSGHGERSVAILENLIHLTEEERLCIRWHMGAFDDKANWGGYTEAVRKFPNVLWTHTADMIASQIHGV